MAGRDAVPGMGELLRAAREAAGLTQAAAAERAGVDRVGLVRFETEVRTPSVATLVKLAAAYGVDPGALIPKPQAPGSRKRTRRNAK